jgi:hypothetical protein
VAELRRIDYLVADASTPSGVGERLVVDLAPALDAQLLPRPRIF